MKLHWIVDAERRIPFLERGLLGKLLTSVDGRRDWHPISTAPFNQDLELMVLDHDKKFVIPFPCRQTTHGWIDGDLGVCLNLNPTVWRLWVGGPFVHSPASVASRFS